MAPGVWILIFWCLVGGILGAVVAQSKNRQPWEGALLGVLLGLIGVLIVAVLPKLPDTPAAAVRGLATRHPSTEERPPVAQAHLDQAAKAVVDRHYAEAARLMHHEGYEADRRGDVEALKTMIGLAIRIEEAPDASSGAKAGARALVVRLDQVLQTFQKPESEETYVQPSAPIADTGGTSAGHGGGALDIVRERYARGEITRDEFQQLKADLA